MAGGKLSPRQKMINMMYLVLLALLAMNISKEVLDSFEVLRSKLGDSAATANVDNSDFITQMKDLITEEIDNENKTVNQGLRDDTLDLIRGETQKVISLIDEHIGKMEEFGLKDPETGELTKKDELELNFRYWMGEGDKELANNLRGAGKAFELRNTFDGYSNFIVDMYNSQVKGDDAEGNKIKVDDYLLEDYVDKVPEHNETWERHNFKGPVVANLAFLEALKIDVYKNERELLDQLATRLGVAKFKVDKFTPVTAPEATIVPAGMQFKAKLYLTLSSSQIKPSFAGNGVKTDASGDFAVLTLPASGNVIPKGKKEGVQKYSATVSMTTTSGKAESYPVNGEFIVRKPEVVITSATVQNLYRNCGNAINIDVPALGDLYNPKVTASDADINQSKESKVKFLIVPRGRQCIVGVSTLTNGQTIKIDDVKYTVIEPPKPTVQMLVNGRPYNGASPVPKTSRVLVQILSDEEFKAALPNDARYGVSSIDVLAQLSLGPPKRVNSVQGNSNAGKGIPVSLGTEVRQAPPGTKVYVRINEIYRRNFRNQMCRISVSLR